MALGDGSAARQGSAPFEGSCGCEIAIWLLFSFLYGVDMVACTFQSADDDLTFLQQKMPQRLQEGLDA